ncbi:acyltransferase family protein [Blastococcus mobilis]|uniref:acyltransferase family protein n=1 Tax=Blastococcus mobilis TaxID=1938746 RepID=UPI00159597C2|nr:acyltransferase [Blastococcus mobilis]
MTTTAQSIPPASPTKRGRGEIRALTGLRAVAATWVVLFHFRSLLTPYLDHLPLAEPLVDAGWIGVELFFILSGFVIALRYLDEVGGRPTPAVVARFVWNRIARVWPAWAVLTVIMGGWIWTLRSVGWDADVLGPHPDADVLTMVRQLSMTQMWGEDNLLGASYLIPGWSISAEWLAYLAFPLLAVLLRPLRRLHPAMNFLLAHLAITPLVVISYRTGPLDWSQNWLLRIACAFTAGMLLALALRDMRTTPALQTWAARLTWVTPLVVVLVSVWASWRAGGDPGVDFHGVAVLAFPALIAALAVSDRGTARWLARPALVYGGRISYCLYLVHFAVLEMALTVAWQDPATRFHLTPELVLLMPLGILVAFGLSALLHHGVEKPCQRLMVGPPRRFARRVAARDNGLRAAGGSAKPRIIIPGAREAATERLVPSAAVSGRATASR